MKLRATFLALCLSLAAPTSYAESPLSVKNEKVKVVAATIPVHPGFSQFVRFTVAPNGVTLKIRFTNERGGPNAQMKLVDGSNLALRIREANVFLKTPGAAQDEVYRTYLQVLSECYMSARLNLRAAPGGSAYLEVAATEKNPVEIAFFPNPDSSDPGDALQINLTSFKDLQFYCTN